MIRYGTNPIAWSNDDDPRLGADISLAQCLDEAAAIGFDGIEKGHKLPATPEGVAAELGRRGLAYIGGWHSLNLLAQDVDVEKAALAPFLDFLVAVGARIVVVAETSNAIHTDPRAGIAKKPVLAAGDWAGFGAGIEALAVFAAERGVTLVYHHHMGTVVETPDEIDRLMAATGPATKLLFDTGHCLAGGGDPGEVAGRHMHRVAHLHAKNVRAEVLAEMRAKNLSFLDGVRRGVFTVPGDPEGCVDFVPVLATAAAHGYSGWLVVEAEQDPALRDPFEYQSTGLAALRARARQAGLDTEATDG